MCCYFFFFLMIRRPPRSTRTDTLFPYTTLFRSSSKVPPRPWAFRLWRAKDMAKLTKKQKALETAVDRNKLHGVDEAIALVKKHATAKFDETMEIAMNLGVDPRHADQMVRGVVTLPAGTGRTEERRVGKECVSKGRSRVAPE